MKFLLVLFLAFAPVLTCSQKSGRALIDSLLIELPKAKEDTNKVKLLDNLSFNYSVIAPDSGLAYANQEMSLSERLKWKPGTARAYACLGINYAAMSQQAKALEYDIKALKLSTELGNRRSMAGNMANIGLVYMSQSDYPDALEYALKALKMYEELGDKSNEAVLLENIGSIYFEQKNYARTSDYYQQALQMYQELGDQIGTARNLGNKGMVEDVRGNYQKALDYHMTALRINEKLGNNSSMQVNQANVGYVYCHMKQYDKALRYQNMAMAASKALHNDNSLAIDMGNIGETYLAMARGGIGSQNIANAIKYLEDAVQLCRRLNYLAPMVEFSKNLSEAYELTGNAQKALEAYKQFEAAEDSVFSVERSMQMSRLETQREIALKDKDLQIKDKQLKIHQLELNEKRNESILYITSIILLVLLVGIAMRVVIGYRRSNMQLAKEKQQHLILIEEQIKHIKIRNEVLEEIAHMQAHDIRGPVATILGLSESLNEDEPSDPSNQVVISGIRKMALKLDSVIKEILRKSSKLS